MDLKKKRPWYWLKSCEQERQTYTWVIHLFWELCLWPFLDRRGPQPYWEYWYQLSKPLRLPIWLVSFVYEQCLGSLIGDIQTFIPNVGSQESIHTILFRTYIHLYANFLCSKFLTFWPFWPLTSDQNIRCFLWPLDHVYSNIWTLYHPKRKQVTYTWMSINIPLA